MAVGCSQEAVSNERLALVALVTQLLTKRPIKMKAEICCISYLVAMVAYQK